MILLDTTFLVDILRGKKESLKAIKIKEPLFTTQINMYEIIKGLFLKNITKTKLVEVMDIFNNIKVIPLDDDAIIKSAEIYTEKKQKGLGIHNFDCMTAGIALSKDVNTIVTRNKEHFKRIKGIKVETY